MPPTQARCTQTGTYQTECRHKAQITIKNGETFPQCPKGKHIAQWKFVKAN